MFERNAETDLDVLNQFRHRVAYGGTINSLVEWTLSEEWETVPTRFEPLCACSGEIADRSSDTLVKTDRLNKQGVRLLEMKSRKS